MKTSIFKTPSSKRLPSLALLLTSLAFSAIPDPRQQHQSKVDSALRTMALGNSAATSRLDSSIASLKSPGRSDSTRLLRYGQKALRTGDPSLFATSGGSVGPDYQIGPGDELIISVWGQKQAKYQPVVDRDGQIYLESAGMINLNGATFHQAEESIGRKLSSIYSGISSGITHYDITMGKLKQLRIFVVGEVEKPGGYVFSGASTALQAVAVAGGPTDLGSDRLALISRGGKNIEIDLYQYLFLGKRAAKDNLQDGDVIRIPVHKASVRVKGEINRPGVYEILSNESTANLIEFAGGLTPKAAIAPMTLSRIYDNGRRDAGTLGTPQDALQGIRQDQLRDGDEITIQLGTARSNASLAISGAVRYPGTYQFLPGANLRGLIQLAGGTTERALISRALILREDSLGNKSAVRANIETEGNTPLRAMDSVMIADRLALDSAPEIVNISGAVRNPGSFAWRAGMKLKDLVVLAGGYLPQADLHSVRVDHKEIANAKVDTKTYDLDTGFAPNSKDVALLPQSLVSIPAIPGWSALKTVVLSGLFSHPATYSLKGESERISSVVERAGGPLKNGYTDGAIFLRKGTGRLQVNLKAALRHTGSDDDIVMEDGDSLLLPPQPATVLVEGRVRKAGYVLWRDGKDWEWYVEMAGGMTDSSDVKDVYVEYADGSIRTNLQGLKDPNPGSVVTVPFRTPPPKATLTDALSTISVIVGILATVTTTWLLIDSRK